MEKIAERVVFCEDGKEEGGRSPGNGGPGDFLGTEGEQVVFMRIGKVILVSNTLNLRCRFTKLMNVDLISGSYELKRKTVCSSGEEMG